MCVGLVHVCGVECSGDLDGLGFWGCVDCFNYSASCLLLLFASSQLIHYCPPSPSHTLTPATTPELCWLHAMAAGGAVLLRCL